MKGEECVGNECLLPEYPGKIKVEPAQGVVRGGCESLIGELMLLLTRYSHKARSWSLLKER